jgi:hypothetical protein
MASKGTHTPESNSRLAANALNLLGSDGLIEYLSTTQPAFASQLVRIPPPRVSGAVVATADGVPIQNTAGPCLSSQQGVLARPLTRTSPKGKGVWCIASPGASSAPHLNLQLTLTPT